MDFPPTFTYWCLRLQPAAMTLWASGFAPVTGQHDPILYLILILFHHVEEIVNTLEHRISIPEERFLGIGKLVIRPVYGEPRCLGHTYQCFFPFAHLLTFPAHDSIVVDRKRFIRYHQIFVNAYHFSKSFTHRTSADRAIKVEHQIVWLFKCHTVGLETIGKMMRLTPEASRSATSTRHGLRRKPSQPNR